MSVPKLQCHFLETIMTAIEKVKNNERKCRKKNNICAYHISIFALMILNIGILTLKSLNTQLLIFEDYQ